MSDVGEFVLARHEIEVKHWNEPVYLIPFGDIHRHSPLCHIEKWKEFLGWARKKPRAFFVGMGDYDDLMSGSERAIVRRNDFHESTEATMDSIYKKFTDELAKELSFMNGRLIGLLEGNHFVRFSDGTTSTQRLCSILDCKYLGSSAFIRLTLSFSNSCFPVDIWAHHGLGASRLVGGSLNRVQYMAEIAEADLYLMGHDHRKAVAPASRLRLLSDTKNPLGVRLPHRKQLFCRTGSFLRGYVPGEKSYVSTRQLNPTDLGVVKIELTLRRSDKNHEERRWVDMHASL